MVRKKKMSIEWNEKLLNHSEYASFPSRKDEKSQLGTKPEEKEHEEEEIKGNHEEKFAQNKISPYLFSSSTTKKNQQHDYKEKKMCVVIDGKRGTE